MTPRLRNISQQPAYIQEVQTLITKRLVAPLLAESPPSIPRTNQDTLNSFSPSEVHRIEDALRQVYEKYDRPEDTSLSKNIANIRQAAEHIRVGLLEGRIPNLTADFLAGESNFEFAEDPLLSMSEYRTENRPHLAEKCVIVLHGPPGSGKSTLIRLAAQQGVLESIDLETLGDTTEERLERFRALPPQTPTKVRLYGSANLFTQFGLTARRVLLLPPLDTYIQRFEARNILTPHKRWQSEIRSYAKWNARRPFFDLVLETVEEPVDTLKRIESFVLGL